MAFFPKIFPTLDYFGDPNNIPGGPYLPLAGGTMSGDIDMGGNDIPNVTSISGFPDLTVSAATLRLSGVNPFELYSSVSGTVATISLVGLTNNRNYFLPDSSGTIALQSDLSGYVPEINGTILIDNESSPDYFALTTDSGAYVTPWLEMDPTFFYLGADIAGIDFGSTSANDLTIRNAIGVTGKIAIGVGNTTPIEIVHAVCSIRLNASAITTTGNININGYTLYGNSAVSGNLQLNSTSDVTKGFIYLGTGFSFNETLNRIGLGTLTPQAVIDVIQGASSATWTEGIGINYRSSTFTNTTSSGTVSSIATHYISGGTLAASSATTYTNAYGTIFTTPVAGSLVTLTSAFAIRVEGLSQFTSTIRVIGSITLSGGNRSVGTSDSNNMMLISNNLTRLTITPAGLIAIGPTPPTASAYLTIAAGTATANTAPLKLTAGTNLTTPESGAIEFDGTKFYSTNSLATRATIEEIRTVVSSAGTLAIAVTSTHYVFTGTTTTWTLAAISGNTNAKILIKNRGTGDITLNSNAGGNEIYTTSALASITIAAGSAVFLVNDGTYWLVE